MSGSDSHTKPLNVVLYWHMHQPEYRDLQSGEYHLPWTYLHTIKDYIDMVAHIENCPQAKAVVNFAPILLEQIDDYAIQLADYLNEGKKLRDPLLSALIDDSYISDNDKAVEIISACLRANKERLIDRFDSFKSLSVIAEDVIENTERLLYCSNQFFIDLVVWYHLAWTAETVRKSDARIKSLMKKGKNFSLSDRHILIEIYSELIAGVIPRYKKLAIEKRVELSMTPYAHPIVPLLIDIESANQAVPDIELPESQHYPGGMDRAFWHIKKGIQVFEHYFGFKPNGCWPSEGSISEETIRLIDKLNIGWLASGETVLRNSLEKSGMEEFDCLHTPYNYDGLKPVCFFRDDGLSDLIGFKYSDWHADDAVANLVTHLESIHTKCSSSDNPIVSIILDGENAWEYYPENGYYFLSALYEKLSDNKYLKLTTYSEFLEADLSLININNIVAGSWVYGTFTTWIGEKDKNRAWDMLVEAKKTYDRVIGDALLSAEEAALAENQLATCESSDWFWWFGEYNSAESVKAFDEQYRMHLTNLYLLLNETPPEYLSSAFSFGSGHPAMGGAMLPGKQQ